MLSFWWVTHVDTCLPGYWQVWGQRGTLNQMLKVSVNERVYTSLYSLNSAVMIRNHFIPRVFQTGNVVSCHKFILTSHYSTLDMEFIKKEFFWREEWIKNIFNIMFIMQLYQILCELSKLYSLTLNSLQFVVEVRLTHTKP